MTSHPVDPPVRTGEAPPPDGSTLQEDIRRLVELADAGPVRFGQIFDTLGERAGSSLLVILSLAFLVVPVPGVSTAASVVFFVLVVTTVLGRQPYLPEFARRCTIPQAYARRMFAAAQRGAQWAGRYVRPRWTFLASGVFRWVAGVSLLTAVVAFALPIPIPFNNSPPAFCMLLLGLGLLMRDGVLVLLGHVSNVVLWLVMLLAGQFLFDLGRQAVQWWA